MITISEEEYVKIKKLRKENKNKRVEKLLQVLVLRYEGKSNREITAVTGYNTRYVTTLLGRYSKQGLEEFIRIKQTSHNRRLSESEEAALLQRMEANAEKGQILTVAEIRNECEKLIGRKTAYNYVYRMLKRNGWRKVMPRSRHPKAATQEEQDSSKKLIACMPK